MANNYVEFLASLHADSPKKANWNLDSTFVGSNDFGFLKVRDCFEVIAGSTVRYDISCNYTTNPTITPVLSGAKVTLTAIWIPLSLYVPALRDGVQVKAGHDDYAFPTINFDYISVNTLKNSLIETNGIDSDIVESGDGLPYIPANSIYTSLRMWRPYFQPGGFCTGVNSSYPTAKNAIPLLGYLDFVRHYVYNTQTPYIPVTIQGYSRRYHEYNANGIPLREPYWSEQPRRTRSVTRSELDRLFKDVRSLGSLYPESSMSFNISSNIGSIYGGLFAPEKKVLITGQGDEKTIVAFNDDHFGEFSVPYAADPYTAFLSNENVEYERSTARVVADDGGVITMEQIYSASRVQNFVRRTIFKNSDYQEYIDAQYGVTPPMMLNKPLFLGSMSTWLSWNDVVSQAQTAESDFVDSNTQLGSRSALGFGRIITGRFRDKKDRPFVRFTAKEPGYFMLLEQIVPDVSYWEGYNPMYDKLRLGSLYYPAFDKDGYQDKQLRYVKEQIIHDFNSRPVNFAFNSYNVAYAQEPAWWEYMTTPNVVTDQMVDNGVYRHWSFIRSPKTPYYTSGTQNATTSASFRSGEVTQMSDIYVMPEDFSHIFANTQGIDNIQVFGKIDRKVYQPLSHRFLSF